MPGKTDWLLLHSSLVKTAHLRDRRKTHFPDLMTVILRYSIEISTLEKNTTWHCEDYFLLFQELLCCCERLRALPASSANLTLHLQFTPFPLPSVHLQLDAEHWYSRWQGIPRPFLSTGLSSCCVRSTTLPFTTSTETSSTLLIQSDLCQKDCKGHSRNQKQY